LEVKLAFKRNVTFGCLLSCDNAFLLLARTGRWPLRLVLVSSGKRSCTENIFQTVAEHKRTCAQIYAVPSSCPHAVFSKVWPYWPCKRHFELPQIFYLNTEMVVKRVYFDGVRKAGFYCTLRDRWKNLKDRFSLSKHLKNTAACMRVLRSDKFQLHQAVNRHPFTTHPTPSPLFSGSTTPSSPSSVRNARRRSCSRTTRALLSSTKRRAALKRSGRPDAILWSRYWCASSTSQSIITDEWSRDQDCVNQKFLDGGPGAWNLGSGSTNIVLKASESYK